MASTPGPPRFWRTMTAAIDQRWPELAVSDPLPPPVPFRLVMTGLVLVFLLLGMLGMFSEAMPLAGSGRLVPGLAVTFAPVLLVWWGLGAGALSLSVSYAIALVSQSPVDVMVPAVLCTITMTMWARWGFGMILLLSQLTGATALLIFADGDVVRPLAFLLASLVAGSAALGWSIRFFRCRARLVELRVVQLETEVLSARDAERRDLARELHDLVAHDVTATALRAHAGLLSRDVEAQERALRDIADGAAGTIQDLRRMVSALQETAQDEASPLTGGRYERPAAPTDSMDSTLHRCRQLLEDSGFRQIEVTQGEGWEQISTSVRSACQRALWEGAANAVRHGAPTGRVRLSARIEQTADGRREARVEVENAVRRSRRTRASGPDQVFLTGGLGLVGLRERVDIFGGDLEYGRRGQTWRICARIPLLEADLRA